MTQPGFPAYGSVPPYSLSNPGFIPPNPHRPRAGASMLPFILGGAGAFVFLLVAGGGIALFAMRSKSVALPVDAKLLPAQTTGVSTQVIEATRETNQHVKRA
jgi:hypothetical protein